MILPGIIQRLGRLTRSIAVVAALAVMTLMSCSHDTPDLPAGEDQTGVVAFSVVAFKTAGSFVGSRATWGDEYPEDPGVQFDTRIHKAQLYVMITDEACTREYAVTNLVCTDSVDNGITVAYKYQGRISEEDLDDVAALGTGKLHIIANAGYNPELSDNTAFSRYGRAGTDFNSIPMWGVKQITNLSDVKDPTKILNLQDVAMLRSMAKVVITRDADDTNYIRTLKSVTVSAIHTDGYLLPAGWQAIKETKTLDRHALRTPIQSKEKDVRFTFTNNRVEFYLPEIENPTGDDELRLTLTYQTKDGVDRTGELLFRQYSGGEPTSLRYDLLRNYLYEYTLRVDVTDLNVEVDVDPYTIVDLDPIFGLTHPTTSPQEP